MPALGRDDETPYEREFLREGAVCSADLREPRALNCSKEEIGERLGCDGTSSPPACAIVGSGSCGRPLALIGSGSGLEGARAYD